jgi:hypothetical protein
MNTPATHSMNRPGMITATAINIDSLKAASSKNIHNCAKSIATIEDIPS